MMFTDGAAIRISGTSGMNDLARVFAPRWWQLHRWLRWWLASPQDKGTITLADGKIRYVRLESPGPKPHRYDGMLTSTPDGSRLCRVFVPRWWQLHRWIWWSFPVTAPRAKGWLTLSLGVGVLVVRYYVDDKTRLSLRRY